MGELGLRGAGVESYRTKAGSKGESETRTKAMKRKK